MRLPGVLGFLICLILAFDVYIVFRLIKTAKKKLAILYSALTVVLYIILIAGLIQLGKGQTDSHVRFMMWAGFTFLSFSIAKIIGALFDLISLLPRLWKGRQWRLLDYAGIVLACLIFIGMWWGALINRFRIDINRVEIVIPDLPDTFDGFTIAQISDLHTGTFGSDTTFTAKIVDTVNSLDADLVAFTGDIVNSRTVEITPHIAPLSRLTSKNGVVSILGNHDYGDYFSWASESEKSANLNRLKEIQRGMGWNLLLNDSETLRRGTDSLVIVGVENIGDPPFKCYGSLSDSYPDLTDSAVKVLLSHNPAHWVDSIADSGSNIALTLSGHTHAMQIEVLGLSPASFKYNTWGGLYHDTSGTHQLYVNIGAGTVGLPMRFGATPEITLITLRKQSHDAR